MPRNDNKPVEHKLGSKVVMRLPESRGGVQTLKVVANNSCEGCMLKGLGHSHCPTVNCSRYGRSDGHGINYVKEEKDD